MQGSLSSAAASQRRATSIFASGVSSGLASARSRSGTPRIRSCGSGRPACGSSAVTFASEVASSTTRSRDSRERSDVEAAADARPAKTRRDSRASRAWVTVSRSPSRTTALKALSSIRYPSAAVAPLATARVRTPTSRSSFTVAETVRPVRLGGWPDPGTTRLRPAWRDSFHSGATQARPCSVPHVPTHSTASYGRAADGQVVDADRRKPHTHRDRLAFLAAGAHALVQLEVATDADDARQRLGAIADQRRALDRRGHAPVLDEIGLARREDELPVGDVDLTAAEAHRVDPTPARLDDALGVVLPRRHERVGHAGHRRVRVGLPPSVAGRRHPHEARVQAVLHVADEDALLDQHRPPRRRALVVDVERTAAVRDRPVVDHGHELRGDLLAHPSRERRGSLAVEVALEAVADRLVEQDARPARPEHDGHRAGGSVHGAELEDGLARRLPREPAPALVLEEEVERDAPAAAVGADLALAALLGDRGHVESRQRPDVADRPARGRRDQRHDLLARERYDHLRDAWIGGPCRAVHLSQKVELPREVGRERRLGERVEIVRPAARRNGNDPRGGRAVGDRARLARRLLQILERDVVGMRVAGARSGQRPDPRPLADVAGGLFHRSFLELELFVHTVLEVDIGIVGASDIYLEYRVNEELQLEE